MVTFTVHLQIAREDCDQARRILPELVSKSRREPGCVTYNAHESKETVGRFLIYEQYRDETALEAHRASPHFQRLAAGGLYRLKVESRVLEFYQALD